MRRLGRPKVNKENTVFHKIRRVPQPFPIIVKTAKGIEHKTSGNCYACAVLAVANHFGKRSGFGRKQVAEAMDLFSSRRHKPYIDSGWRTMKKALKRLDLKVSQNKIAPYKIDLSWYFTKAGVVNNCHEFAKHFKKQLESGALILVGIKANYKKEEESIYTYCNHYAVIDGYREKRVPIYFDKKAKPLGHSIHNEFHLADSSSKSPGYYWIDAEDMVKYLGGANAYFVKRR